MYYVITDPSIAANINVNVGWNGNTLSFIECGPTNPTTIQESQMINIQASSYLIGHGSINNTPIKYVPFTGNLIFLWCSTIF